MHAGHIGFLGHPILGDISGISLVHIPMLGPRASQFLSYERDFQRGESVNQTELLKQIEFLSDLLSFPPSCKALSQGLVCPCKLTLLPVSI